MFESLIKIIDWGMPIFTMFPLIHHTILRL